MILRVGRNESIFEEKHCVGENTVTPHHHLCRISDRCLNLGIGIWGSQKDA